MNELSTALNRIKNILEKNQIRITQIKEIKHGFQLKVNHPELNGYLRIYSGKKGIKIDQSQLKAVPGGEIARILNEKLNLEIIPPAEKNHDLSGNLVGCDESGKGDYFGPLVCAAVYIDEQREPEWREYSIQDSKTLSDQKNFKIGETILNLFGDFIELAELWPPAYNEKYSQLKKQHLNLNNLLADLHIQAITKLISRHFPDTVIIDQFSSKPLFDPRRTELPQSLNIVQITGGEKYLAVAAASVVARYRYLKILNDLSAIYGMKFPKGAGEKVDKFAQKFVIKYGREKLNEVAKVHFKTTTKLDVLEFY